MVDCKLETAWRVSDSLMMFALNLVAQVFWGEFDIEYGGGAGNIERGELNQLARWMMDIKLVFSRR